MNINKLIIDTLKPIIPNNDTTIPKPSNVVPSNYEGKSNIYCTFNYADDRGINFADDSPKDEQSSLQIHLFCPGAYNYNNLKKQIRSALFGADFSFPVITELYEKDTKLNHITFECDYVKESEV